MRTPMAISLEAETSRPEVPCAVCKHEVELKVTSVDHAVLIQLPVGWSSYEQLDEETGELVFQFFCEAHQPMDLDIATESAEA